MRPDPQERLRRDRSRLDAAAWSMIRALQIIAWVDSPAGPRTAWRRRRSLQTASDYLTAARGYLGAVGFEGRGRD